jgi:hypothetical protein
MTSELMRATVAEPQGDAREGGAERSGRQTCDHRKANRQRGRQWATSVLANTKSNSHQDTASRVGWRAGKVQALTRGDLPRESVGEVSRGRSSEDRSRGLEDARLNCETGTLRPVKGQRNQQQRSMAPCATGPKEPRRQQAVVGNHDTLREPSPARRCSRRNRGGERNSGMHA